MKNILKLLLIIIISILAALIIFIGYLFVTVLNMPYDDLGTYMDENDMVHHSQSIMGYGSIFCLMFLLIGVIIFCFRNTLCPPKLKEFDELDGSL